MRCLLFFAFTFVLLSTQLMVVGFTLYGVHACCLQEFQIPEHSSSHR